MRLTSTSLYTASGINVGIGTSSPQDALDITKAAGTAAIRIASQGVGSITWRLASQLVGVTNAGFVIRDETNTTNRLVIDGSGNVGIGTSSPSGRLSVKGSTSDSSANALFVEDSTGAAIFRVRNDGDIYMGSGGKAILDSSGNLGLGVTPSAWYDPINWKTLQINYLGMFAKQGNDSRFYSNAFLNTSGIDKYLSADYASQYKMTTGGHQWFTAPLWNGTGSDTITFTQAMTLDASGNLGVGTTSPTYRLHVANGYVGILRGIAYNASASIGIDLGASNSDSVNNSATYAWGQEVVGDASGQSLIFKSYRRNDTTVERARITSGGDLLVGTTSAIAGAKMSVVGNVNDTLVRLQNQNATAPGGLDVHYSGAATNDVNNWFYLGRDSSANRFYVQSNGGIANYQANNVNLSDRREKTNFAPAKSYLDIICAIPVQTFNYIDQNMENDGGLTLGVVAQDVQAVAPELVMESNWGTKDNPKMRLSIYQTDLQYALMKCIQEQQALIESLTTRVVQLEGA
jgi:hypothetical protein